MQADKQSFPPVADVAGLSVLVLGAGAGVGPAVVGASRRTAPGCTRAI